MTAGQRYPTITDSNMKQHVKRQHSQCEDIKRDKVHLHKPTSNEIQDMASEVQLDLETTVEPISTSDSKIVAEIFGKGISTNDKEIRDENVVVSTVTMAKQRKNLWVVLLVLVAVVVMASGILVCWMYPTSTAVTLFRVVADKVVKDLKLLQGNFWNVLGLYTDLLGEVLRVKWLALLRSRMLENTARAIKLQGFFGLIQAKPIMSFCFNLVKIGQEYTRLMILGVFDAVHVSIESMHSVLMELVADNELLEQVRVFLLSNVISFVNAGRWIGELVMSGVAQVFEWQRVNIQSVDLGSEQIVATLMTQQATALSIGKALTVQETQALRDVKRLEERRSAITSATNSLLEDARSMALDSVFKIKLAAMDFIDKRSRHLADEYVQVFEQAIQDYELVLCQVEDEVGSKMLHEMTLESKKHIDAAANLKRDISMRGKADREQLSDLPDHFSFEKELQDEVATDNYYVDIQHDEKSKSSEGVFQVSVLEKQIAADSVEKSRVGFQFVSESADQTNEEARDKSILGKTVEDVHVNKEQEQIVYAELSEVFVSVDKLTPTEDAIEVENDQSQTIAKLDDKTFHDVTPKSQVVGAMRKTVITAVTAEFDNAVLEVGLVEGETLNWIEVQNVAATNVVKQEAQQQRVEAHLKTSVDRTDSMDLDVSAEITNFEQVDVTQALANERTPDTAQIDKNSMENQRMELAKSMAEFSVEGFLPDETERNQVNAESLLNVDVSVAGVKKVIEKLQDTDRGTAKSVHIYEDIAAAQIGLLDDTSEVRSEDNAKLATDVKILTPEGMEVAMEIHELELLEQTLLQDDDERLGVEEELRVIAEKEGIWLHSDQRQAEGKPIREDVTTSEQLRIVTIGLTETREVATDSQNDNWQPRFSPVLMRVGLFSMVFLGLAALTAYLLARHQRRGFFALAPRRQRKRWQRLAVMTKSEAEEVVLLSGDCSEEDDETDIVETKRFCRKDSMEANDVVKAIDFESVEDDGDKEVHAMQKQVDEKEQTVREEEPEAVETRSGRTRSRIAERVQTTMYTDSVSSNPDESVDEGTSTSVSSHTTGSKTVDVRYISTHSSIELRKTSRVGARSSKYRQTKE